MKSRIIAALVLFSFVLYLTESIIARDAAVSNFQLGTAASQNKEINGDWNGVLSAAGTDLRLVLKISHQADRSWKASMDSLDQPGSMGLVVDIITLMESSVHFEMKAIRATYDGELSADGGEILGTWSQGGNRYSLVFQKAGVAPSNKPVKRGKLELQPCNRATLTRDALCGKYEVFENRSFKTGRKIALNMILLSARGSQPAADATFYLVGGPGAAATASASAGFITRLRAKRDVVLVDQRGTGQSNPLNCEFHDRSDMQSYFTEPFVADKVRACRETLEKVADLKLYTTALAMDDLDEIRAALGYDKINVYGGSYGSTTSLAYLRQHPEHVRTVTITSVAPPSAKIPLSFPKGVQHAMDRLFDDCIADAACNTAYPKLREDFAAALKQFDNGPLQVTATNVVAARQDKISLSREAFIEQIRLMLYVPQAMGALPFFIHAGAGGNFGPFVATAFQVAYQIYGQIAQGMQLSVVCAEDAPFITEQEIKRESAGSFYGDTRMRQLLQACSQWPLAQVPASFVEPVKGSAPVLLISGEIDPVTPPVLAASAAQHLPNSRQLLVHNGTHTSYDCTEKLAAEFIDRGSVKDLDVSCLDQVKRPPFLIR